MKRMIGGTMGNQVARENDRIQRANEEAERQRYEH